MGKADADTNPRAGLRGQVRRRLRKRALRRGRYPEAPKVRVLPSIGPALDSRVSHA